MIIDNQKSGVLEVYGENTSRTATINSAKIAKLQYILTEGLYSDPMGATIVEITNNAMDSVIEAGNDEPVIVEFITESHNRYRMVIEDKGIGMDKEFFESIFMSMLSSTKEENDDVIGNFGIGGKSWVSLKKTVTFTITKDGKRCVYLCYKGEEFIDYDLLTEEDTAEPNGVKFELPLNGWNEYNSFVTKAKQKLSYYDGVVLVINGQIWKNTIHRDELFQWCSAPPYGQMHLCLKDVVYPIDYNRLGINNINIPIALRFTLKDGIIPTPSRESILMSASTIELIKERIRLVAAALVGEYNKQTGEFPNIKEAWDHLNNVDRIIKLEDDDQNEIRFRINDLEQHSSIPISPHTVKGITLKDAGWYKQNSHELSYRMNICARYDGQWKTKRFYMTGTQLMNHSSYKGIIVNKMPVGNVREFLKQKYPNWAYFVYDNGVANLQFYRTTILRGVNDKRKWRAYIKEYQHVQDQIFSSYIDERALESTAEYEKWLEEHRKWLKDKREKKDYIKTSLGKEEGDITIGWYRQPSINRKNMIAVVEKEAVTIEDIKNIPNMIVYTTENSERIQLMNRMMPLVKFCLIGPREVRKLPEIEGKIIKFEEFMKGNNKPFNRLASAILFGRAVKDYNNMGAEGIVKECIQKYAKDVAELGKYINANYNNFDGNYSMEEDVIRVCQENNLFDKQLWDVYMRVVENNKKYEFLRVFSKPSVHQPQNTKDRYSRVINQMLLFRKKYYNDFEEYDFLVQKKADVVIATEPPF